MRLLNLFFGWIIEERRLAAAEHWGAGTYHNRTTPPIFTPECAQAELPPFEPFTRLDPACRKVELRQRLARQKLRDRGIGGPRVPISSGWAHDPRAYAFVRRHG